MACAHANKTVHGKEGYVTQAGVAMLRTIYVCPDCQELDEGGNSVGQKTIITEVES